MVTLSPAFTFTLSGAKSPVKDDRGRHKARAKNQSNSKKRKKK